MDIYNHPIASLVTNTIEVALDLNDNSDEMLMKWERDYPRDMATDLAHAAKRGELAVQRIRRRAKYDGQR